MVKKIFEAEYAGHPVRYAFLTPGVRPYFHTWLRPVEGNTYNVTVTPERLQYARSLLAALGQTDAGAELRALENLTAQSLFPSGYSDAYVEFRTLTELTSRFLLPHGCCFFHAVSFLWNGWAWLLGAPSGTGKTTQFLNWQRLHPEEVSMICGDMPLLQRREDGSIWVWPSPWNGKEHLGSQNLSAPLAGVVLLEQGDENHLSSLPPREAILPFFSQFVAYPETEEQVSALCDLMDHLLRTVPVWKLVNLGDDESTEILRSAFSLRVEELTGGTAHAL